MKGRDRNKECPCGSGKKWKRCHCDRPSNWVPTIEEMTELFRKEKNEKATVRI
jgi:hypothetical protein